MLLAYTARMYYIEYLATEPELFDSEVFRPRVNVNGVHIRGDCDEGLGEKRE